MIVWEYIQKKMKKLQQILKRDSFKKTKTNIEKGSKI